MEEEEEEERSGTVKGQWSGRKRSEMGDHWL